jgi:hypothetical protein
VGEQKMTWLDLLEKHGRPYRSEVFGFNIAPDTVVQFTVLGKVSILYKKEYWEAIDIATDRTPEQMDNIIKNLTEKK